MIHASARHVLYLVLALVTSSSLSVAATVTEDVGAPFGYFKPGFYLPVRVTLANTNEPADVEVEISGNGFLPVRATVALGSPEQRDLQLTAFCTAPPKNIEVRVFSHGKELHRITQPLSLSPLLDSEFLIVIISAYGISKGNLPNVSEEYTARRVVVHPSDFPDSVEALDMVDGVIIHDAQMLSPAQANALAKWVRLGGRLYHGNEEEVLPPPFLELPLLSLDLPLKDHGWVFAEGTARIVDRDITALFSHIGWPQRQRNLMTYLTVGYCIGMIAILLGLRRFKRRRRWLLLPVMVSVVVAWAFHQVVLPRNTAMAQTTAIVSTTPGSQYAMIHDYVAISALNRQFARCSLESNIAWRPVFDSWSVLEQGKVVFLFDKTRGVRVNAHPERQQLFTAMHRGQIPGSMNVRLAENGALVIENKTPYRLSSCAITDLAEAVPVTDFQPGERKEVAIGESTALLSASAADEDIAQKHVKSRILQLWRKRWALPHRRYFVAWIDGFRAPVNVDDFMDVHSYPALLAVELPKIPVVNEGESN